MPMALAGCGASRISGANSSRKSRRNDFADREYRANSAPLTVSGRLVSAKTCLSLLVKYGASFARSSSVKCSAWVGGSTVGEL